MSVVTREDSRLIELATKVSKENHKIQLQMIAIENNFS